VRTTTDHPIFIAEKIPRVNANISNGPTTLSDGGFLAATPLWYYILKESEVRANGQTLGEVGSRIVCETMIGSLHHDPRSYLNWRGGWDPSQGARLPNGDPIVTIVDLFRFAGIPA
jgi:hypothetical protein